MTKDEAIQKLAEVKKTAEELEAFINQAESGERWRPGKGEGYYYVGFGGVAIKKWTYDSFDGECWNMGNCFKTEAEAKLHKLRLESMANRWRPRKDKPFWFYYAGNAYEAIINFNPAIAHHRAFYWTGSIHPTKEAAEEWGRTYSRAFEIKETE